MILLRWGAAASGLEEQRSERRRTDSRREIFRPMAAADESPAGEAGSSRREDKSTGKPSAGSEQMIFSSSSTAIW